MVEKTISTIPILSAFRNEGVCPLCSLWTKEELSFLARVETNEMTMSPEFRESVLASAGFCNRHMHLLYDIAFSGRTEDGLGYALYAKDVIASLEKKIDSLQSQFHAEDGRTTPKKSLTGRRSEKEVVTGITGELEKAMRACTVCPVCRMLLDSDRRTTTTFLQMLGDESFARTFTESKGICVPHLVSALELLPGSQVKTKAVMEILIRVTRVNLGRISRLLDERIRKYSWEFRNEKPSKSEAASQETALMTLVGAEGLYCRNRKVSLFIALSE